MASQFISTWLYVLKSVGHSFRKQQEMDFQFAFKHLQLDLMTLPDLYFTNLSKKNHRFLTTEHFICRHENVDVSVQLQVVGHFVDVCSKHISTTSSCPSDLHDNHKLVSHIMYYSSFIKWLNNNKKIDQMPNKRAYLNLFGLHA